MRGTYEAITMVAQTAHLLQGVVIFFLKGRVLTALLPPGTGFSPVQIHLETLNKAGWNTLGVAVTLHVGVVSAMFCPRAHTEMGQHDKRVRVS